MGGVHFDELSDLPCIYGSTLIFKMAKRHNGINGNVLAEEPHEVKSITYIMILQP